MSTQYCDVCSQYVELRDGVVRCGLSSADCDQEMDLGYLNDCPFEVQEWEPDDEVDLYARDDDD